MSRMARDGPYRLTQGIFPYRGLVLRCQLSLPRVHYRYLRNCLLLRQLATGLRMLLYWTLGPQLVSHDVVLYVGLGQ